MKILELKNRKLKLRSQQFNIRLVTAKERIRELEGRSKEYISCKKKKKKKKNISVAKQREMRKWKIKRNTGLVQVNWNLK